MARRRKRRRQRGGVVPALAAAAAVPAMWLTGWHAGKKLAIAIRRRQDNRKARQAYDKMVREIRASDKAHGRGTAIVQTRIPPFEAWKRDNWKIAPTKANKIRAKIRRTLTKVGL